MNSLSRYNLVHKFIPMPQAIKYQKQREKELEKLAKDTCMAADESQKQN